MASALVYLVASSQGSGFWCLELFAGGVFTAHLRQRGLLPLIDVAQSLEVTEQELLAPSFSLASALKVAPPAPMAHLSEGVAWSGAQPNLGHQPLGH